MSNKVKGRKKDKIYEYFNIDETDNKYHCVMTNCKKTFSLKTSTTTLKRHMSTSHEDFIKYKIDNDNIKNMNEKKLNIYTAYSRFFAKNSLPHSLIENSYFIEFVQAIKENPTINISRPKLRNLIVADGLQAKEKVLNNLKMSKIPVTLTVDGWLNIRSNKIMNLLLMADGISYYYDCIENYSRSNTKEWLVKMLEEKIQKIIEDGINLVAITTDNEILMKSVCVCLKQRFPILFDIPCSSHIIQLCLKRMCELKIISDTINNINEILENFKRNKQHKLELYNSQIKDNVKIPLKIIYYSVVRWSSIILTIERLIKLKKYISTVIKTSESFWITLELLYKFIEPIQIYTNRMQSNNASLITVYQCFSEMTAFYKSSNIPDDFIQISKDIIQIIEKYWTKYIDNDLIDITRLFCFETNIKPLDKHIDFIVNWGLLYLKDDEIVKNYNQNKIKRNIKSQLTKLVIKQGEFSKINEYIAEIKEDEENITNIAYIHKLVWGRLISKYYELSKIAIAILSICPSEANVERSFSILADIHTQDRNRLSNDIIDAELSIKMNLM